MENNPFGTFEDEKKPIYGPEPPPPVYGPELPPPVYGPELPPGGLPKTPEEQDAARQKLLDDILGSEFGDQAQKDVLAKTKRPSALEGVGMALAGVGDAIARGYGRLNTDFLKQTMTQSQARRAQEREDFEKGKKGTIEKYFLNQKLETELGRRDPASKLSIIAQDLMKKLDPEGDWSGYSAEQLEPYLGKYQSIYEGKLKAEENRIKAENQNFWKGQAMAERKEKQEYKEREDASKKVDFAINALSGLKRAGASGQFQMANKRVLLSEDAKRVIEALLSGELKKDETIEAELAAQIASTMMGGNQPAFQTIEHFMSPTANRTIAGIYKYVTGKPQDAMTTPIVKHFQHQVEMQIKYWKERRNQVTNGQYVKLEPVFQKYPEERERFEKWASTMFGKEGMVDPRQFGQGGTGGGVGPEGRRAVPERKVQRWVRGRDGEPMALMRTDDGRWERVDPIKGEGTFVPDVEEPNKKKKAPPPTSPTYPETPSAEERRGGNLWRR